MDPKRLPFLPLHFFYQGFSASQKGLFWVLGASLLLMAAAFAVAGALPWHWALEPALITDPQPGEVVVQTLEHSFRSIDLRLQAFRQWISFSAGPIVTHTTPLYLGWLFLWLGWSFFLAVASEVRSRWVYFFYLLHALFLHFSGLTPQLVAADPYRLVEFALIISHLLLAYCFQVRILRWRLPWRVVAILGLSLVAFVAGPLRQPDTAWLAMTQESFAYLSILSILLIFFVAKEPTNLIFFLTTNYRQARYRWDARLIFIPLLALLVVEVIWLDEYMKFDWLNIRLPFRPWHLFALAVVTMPLLSQNHFPQVRNIFSDRSLFTYLLMSWALIVLSFLFMEYTMGDPFFRYTLERLMVILFLGVGAAHIFFVFTNHQALLVRRIPLYYLMTQGLRFSMVVIWLIGLGGLVFAEGRDAWKTFYLLYHSYHCHSGDLAMQKGDPAAAKAAYEQALLGGPTSVKANYNLGVLNLPDLRTLNRTIKYFQAATGLYEFPYARLNAASLLVLGGQPAAARQLLRDGMPPGQVDPLVANNLGLLYAQAGEPDSAILAFQAALLADLDLAPAYANLAQVYALHDRPEAAGDFFRAALDAAEPTAPILTNVAWWCLYAADTLDLSPYQPLAFEDDLLTYNLILLGLREGRTDLPTAALKALAQTQQSPDALLLDGWLMFQADSIEYARSRLTYLPSLFPAYAAQANFVMGLAYFSRGVPEMALPYFQAAGEQGMAEGQLQAAKMMIDLGQGDSAVQALYALRATDAAYWEPAARELAMLLAAYGQPLYAEAEWPLASLTHDERVRISRYADSLAGFAIALENFRQLLDQDSSTLAPYLEMGRIYNRYRDTLAVENLAYGLQVAPDHVPMRVAYARARLYRDGPAAARTALAPLGADSSLDRRRLEADIALAEADTTRALNLLLQVLAEKPLDQEATVAAARLLYAQQAYEAGAALLGQAIAWNDANPHLWYEYARVYRAWGMPADAGYGALRAMALTPAPRARAAILAEFSTEVALTQQRP